MTFREAIIAVLRRSGPAKVPDITKSIVDEHLVETGGKTPAATVSATIAVDIQKFGENSTFVRLGDGSVALRETRNGATNSTGRPEVRIQGTSATARIDARVTVPLYPTYATTRAFVKVLTGRRQSDVAALWSSILALTGTPQENEDWSEPDSWIPRRLEGTDREIAAALWEGSQRRANPRHFRGLLALTTRYTLLDADADGIYRTTDAGNDFLRNAGGGVERYIDEREGLLKLLQLFDQSGPSSISTLHDQWKQYLHLHSEYRAKVSVEGTMRERINNLLDRGFLERNRHMYAITSAGRAYLGASAPVLEADNDDSGEVLERISKPS